MNEDETVYNCNIDEKMILMAEIATNVDQHPKQKQQQQPDPTFQAPMDHTDYWNVFEKQKKEWIN